MLHILAVTDGYNHFGEAIRTYIDRLGKKIRLTLIAPEKSDDPIRIKRKETERILALLKKTKGSLWYATEKWKTFSTQAFVQFIQKNYDTSTDIIFLIGGAYGIEEALLSNYPMNYLSLSHFTLPHSLALLVLIEQIYRTGEIAKGSHYHHG